MLEDGKAVACWMACHVRGWVRTVYEAINVCNLSAEQLGWAGRSVCCCLSLSICGCLAGFKTAMVKSQNWRPLYHTTAKKGHHTSKYKHYCFHSWFSIAMLQLPGTVQSAIKQAGNCEICCSWQGVFYNLTADHVCHWKWPYRPVFHHPSIISPVRCILFDDRPSQTQPWQETCMRFHPSTMALVRQLYL